MKKFLFILIFPVVIAAFSSVAFSAGRNNSRQNVLNDDWEDGWEESFFEKEAGRKQILKKENERPVVTPRSNRPKKQEKEESVRLPSREELEASEEQKNSDSEYYDKLISAAERKQAAANSASPSYFSLHPDNARY
ncbi:MAG: hypothetical protein J5706_04915, partial [Elusimicrobiales bacterium]|nr:hypothetical protein [Elusimicrobiales bacterium]